MSISPLHTPTNATRDFIVSRTLLPRGRNECSKIGVMNHSYFWTGLKENYPVWGYEELQNHTLGAWWYAWVWCQSAAGHKEGLERKKNEFAQIQSFIIHFLPPFQIVKAMQRELANSGLSPEEILAKTMLLQKAMQGEVTWPTENQCPVKKERQREDKIWEGTIDVGLDDIH